MLAMQIAGAESIIVDAGRQLLGKGRQRQRILALAQTQHRESDAAARIGNKLRDRPRGLQSPQISGSALRVFRAAPRKRFVSAW